MLKKNFLLPVFILLALFALGGAIFYNQSNQKQKSQSSSAQNHIGDLRFQSKDYTEVTPLQRPAEASKNSGPNNPATAGANPDTQSTLRTQTGSTKVQAGSRQQASSDNIDPLRSQIEQKYVSRLQALAAGYEGRLNSLVSDAVNEYRAAKKDNPNADLGTIASKYYAAGKSLEAESDSQFYSILSAFESELSANSFPLDAAVKAKEAYETRKGAKAGQITAGKP